MTLCLMMEKNKVLGDVLKRVADRKGEFLEKNAFIFKPFNDSFGIHGLKPNNQVGNPDESAQYKAMHNLSVFDMNTEVKNLPTLELQLSERIPGKARSKKLDKKIKKNTALGPYMDIEQKEKHNEEIKKDYEYLYNKYSATSYNVY